MPSERTGWIIETCQHPTRYLKSLEDRNGIKGKGELLIITEYPDEAQNFPDKDSAKKCIDTNPMLTTGVIMEACKAPFSAREYAQMLLLEKISLDGFLEKVTIRPFL